VHGQVRAVVLDEKAEAFFPLLVRRQFVARIGDGAVHQAGDAVADVRLDAFVVQRVHAEMGAHGIGGGHQVGQGVDQRAVEVEGQCLDVIKFHCADFLCITGF
jgi:hypothetical protein